MWWTRGIRSTQARTGLIKVRACADLEGEDPSKHGPEKERLEEARTRRARIQASTDLKSKGRRKPGPGGQRSAQARAGRIKVWVRENQSATRVSKSTG